MEPVEENPPLGNSMQYESMDHVLIEASECHVLTFSEKAVALGQSANYMIGADIALHVVVDHEHSAIVINEFVSGIWQEQSLIYVPKADTLPLQVAIMFRPAEIVVALLGNAITRTITREVELVSVPVQINRSEFIGLQRVAAPARLPAGTGVLDFCGLFPDGSTVLCGWITQPWPDARDLSVTMLVGNVRLRRPAEVLWYHRPDLGNDGTGYILWFSLPPQVEMNRETLSSVEVELDLWSYRLTPHSETQLVEADHARGWMAEVLPRISKGDISALRKVISRPVFSGIDTLGSLSAPCHLETDVVYAVPGKGLLLLGWFLDPMAAVRSLRICSGRVSSPTDLRTSLIRLQRADVRTAFESRYDLSDSSVGFLAYSPVVTKPGSPLYAEIELESGEIGFKPLSSPVAAGVPAIRRVLQSLKFTGDELQPAFDSVLGEPLIAINRARLAKPMPVKEIAFGTISDAPRCSIVVPLYGRLDFVEYQCALFSQGGIVQDELIYVLDEPARKAELLELARICHAKFGLPMRLILPEENRGFGPASNLGLEYARGRHVCFLNSDIFPADTGWLDRLVGSLEADPGIGTVGALCLFADGSVQHAGMDYEAVPHFGGWIFPKHPGKGMKPPARVNRLLDVPGVTGACMVMHRDLALDLGGFDPDYVIGDFEDADLCNRLKARGLRCVVDQEVVLYHLERQSQGNQAMDWRMNLTLLNAWTFNRRWGGEL